MVKKYKDGGIYDGEGTTFTKKRHGKGKMIYANGEIYEGDWVDDVRCGKGKLYRPKLSGEMYSYEGEWNYDKMNGKGKFTDGYTTYEGDFVYGKYDGKGKLTKKIGSYTYEGQFRHGLKEGNGVEKCPEYTYKADFLRIRFTVMEKRLFQTGIFLKVHFITVYLKTEKHKKRLDMMCIAETILTVDSMVKAF